jgi:hypothetical protein
MKFSAARTSFAFDFYIFNKTSSNLHTTMWGITLSLGQRVLQGIQCPLNQTRGAIEHTIMCLTIYLFTRNPFHHNVAMHVLFRCNVTMHVLFRCMVWPVLECWSGTNYQVFKNVLPTWSWYWTLCNKFHISLVLVVCPFKNWLPMLVRLYLSIYLFVRPNQELIPTPHVWCLVNTTWYLCSKFWPFYSQNVRSACGK